MSTTASERLLTANEYVSLPNDGRHTELVRGMVIEMNMPGFEHGDICGTVYFLLREFVSSRDLGRVVCNDAGVLTERNPDTVRGADIAYYSFQRLPRDKRPKGYPDVAPELIIEVLSPTDRWSDVYRKIGEYLDVGVAVVCVLDPDSRKLHIYEPEHAGFELTADDELTVPTVLPDFRVPVRRFFE
jgi:Uma2 family endonuclease